MVGGTVVESVVSGVVVPVPVLPGESLLPSVPTGRVKVSSVLTLVSYQFLHGGWEHLLFNMLFLWVFGDNVEDALGHIRFIAFFVICGVAGGLFHGLIGPQSLTPTIGASGAIAGVLPPTSS